MSENVTGGADAGSFVQQAKAEALVRRRINERHMLSGVRLIDPAATYIEESVEIRAGTVIYPNTHLQGTTRIGADCIIGPNTIVRDSAIGDRCKVEASVIEGAKLEDDVDVGPFAHLREGAHLATGVHMGNFGEVKDSYLGPGVKMGHRKLHCRPARRGSPPTRLPHWPPLRP